MNSSQHNFIAYLSYFLNEQSLCCLITFTEYKMSVGGLCFHSYNVCKSYNICYVLMSFHRKMFLLNCQEDFYYSQLLLCEETRVISEICLQSYKKY